MKSLPKIKIHPLIFPFMGFFFFVGTLKTFFMLLLFVTIHEFSHCLTAVLLGAKVRQILITPVGERAIIKNMERLSYGKRQCILLAGPMVSLLLGIFFLFCCSQFAYFTMNWMIGFFNLLPFLPMDGGMLLLNGLGKRYGTVKAAGILTKVSQGFGYFLILVGIIQAIFFPFNLSLMVIGCYFVSINRKEYVHITYSVYKELLARKKRPLPIRELFVGEETLLGEVATHMNNDYYFIFYREKNGILEKKSQKQVMQALLEQGASGKVWES